MIKHSEFQEILGESRQIWLEFEPDEEKEELQMEPNAEIGDSQTEGVELFFFFNDGSKVGIEPAPYTRRDNDASEELMDIAEEFRKRALAKLAAAQTEIA
jgi:hypothetical protein